MDTHPGPYGMRGIHEFRTALDAGAWVNVWCYVILIIERGVGVTQRRTDGESEGVGVGGGGGGGRKYRLTCGNETQRTRRT